MALGEMLDIFMPENENKISEMLPGTASTSASPKDVDVSATAYDCYNWKEWHDFPCMILCKQYSYSRPCYCSARNIIQMWTVSKLNLKYKAVSKFPK